MPNVNILRRADERATLELMPVPALCVRGPWAVTPSDDKECPGFAVTFVPTGKKVWPNEPGAAGLLRAKELAEALEKAWPHDHEQFTPIEKDRIIFLVRPL